MQTTTGARHEYQFKASLRTLYFVLGLFFIIVCGVVAWNISVHIDPFLVFMLVSFVALGCYLAGTAIVSRLVLDGDQIQVQTLLKTRSATLDEIEGYRTISTRNGSYLQIQLTQGRGTLTISHAFDTDEDFNAWLHRLTDLDEQGRKAILDRIEQDPELGSTPDERLAGLSAARTWNIALSVAAGAALALLLFGGPELHAVCSVMLIFVPVLAILLAHQQPLLYTLFKPRRDPRTDITFAVAIGSFGLLLAGNNNHFVTLRPLLPWMALLAVLVLLACARFLHGNPQIFGAAFALLLLSGLYGFGVITQLDTLPDQAPSSSFTAQVNGEHASHGRSTTYYLDLGPWGPIETNNSISVPWSVYSSTQPGDTICLALHPGALHVPWYQRVSCNS